MKLSELVSYNLVGEGAVIHHDFHTENADFKVISCLLKS